MARRRGEPEAVGDIISGAARRIGMDADMAALVTDAGLWASVVGSDIAAGCRALRCSDATLVVVVSDPVSETRLRYAAAAVRESVNEHLGREVVRNVVVRRDF